MNTLTAHEQYVLDHPADHVAALALVDHHQEATGLDRRTCLRAVARIRRQDRTARELAAAAKLLEPNAHGQSDLRVVLVWQALLRYDGGFTFVLVAGSRPPVASVSMADDDEGYWHPITITVGARFVIAEAKKLATDPGYLELVLRQREARAPHI